MMTPNEVISRLPPRAADRFKRLLSARDAASASSSELAAQLRDLRDDRASMNNGLRNMLNPLFTGQATRLSADDPSVRSMQARIATMDAEIARLIKLIAEQSAAASAAGSLIGRVTEFIESLRPETHLSDHPSRAPSFKKNENVVDAIESRRRRVRELQAAREATASAPIPSAEAKRLARAQVEELAERGRPDIRPLLERGDPIQFSQTSSPIIIPNVAVEHVHIADTTALTAWLFQPQLVAAIDALIGGRADDTRALGDVERARRLEEIAVELLDVERQEVTLIDAALAQAQIIPHRDDVDVRALLSISTTLIAEAA